jgi:quercetin dioxygenase-like cupin family protein
MTFEAWEDNQTGIRMYFSHSSPEFTTGVLLLPPGQALPKHNRPLAVENLVQVSGACLMKVFNEDDQITEHMLKPGVTLSMNKGQYHIHSNPYAEISLTLFKAVGDITAIVDVIRKTFVKIDLN